MDEFDSSIIPGRIHVINKLLRDCKLAQDGCYRRTIGAKIFRGEPDARKHTVYITTERVARILPDEFYE